MFNGIYAGASAMEIESLRHEVTANNLANANTPGFRRTLLAISARQPNNSSEVRGGKPATTHVDFTQGTIMDTGRKLDVAINGEGFFTIDTPEGTRYTRNGSFHLNAENELVTGQGHTVSGGGPIAIPTDAALSSITIGTDGTIRANGSEVGKLDIVAFENTATLKQIQSGLFQATGPPGVPSGDSTIVQGSLESSNASIVHEMISMIIGMRHFEAAQQSLKSISDAVQQYTTLEQ